MLGELLHQLNTQQYAEPTRLTLAQYLEDWLQDKASSVRPTTWQSYAAMVRRHIVPGLGHLALSQLTPVHVQSWCRDQLRRGRALTGEMPRLARARSSTPTPSSIGACGRRSSCSSWRATWRLLAHPPRPERRDVPALGVGLASRLLDAARDTRCHLPVMLR